MTENKKQTLIKNIIDKKEEAINVKIDDKLEDVYSFLMNGYVDVKVRINLLSEYYNKYGEVQCTEIINHIATLYQFSGTSLLEKYIYEICTNCDISSFLKIIAVKSLCYFNPNKELGYNALDIICKNMKNVATPCQIEAICLLMNHKKYKKQSLKYFCDIINNPDLECDYRYKTILSLENKEIPEKQFFLKESSIEFLNNTKNRTLYRILAGQYLIQKCDIKQTILDNVEITLMGFAQDPTLDYNLRADSADVILRLGSFDNKIIAKEIIMILGRQDGNVKTIFDNAQNVHIDEIEQSVIKALEFLSGIPSIPKITFEYVKKKIEDELKKIKPTEPIDYEKYTKNINKTQIKENKLDQLFEKYEEEKKLYDDKEDKINVSLNRIYMDRALYSKYNFSLIHIIIKIWTYLTKHKSEDDIKKRLLEELIEMSGTCSSGFSSRLVNVISGYGDFNINISWRDQIIANLIGRLNARARDISYKDKMGINGKLYNLTSQVCKCCNINKGEELKLDKVHNKKLIELLENFQEKVLEEMTINSNDFASRKNFLKFFRKNMLSIRQELYEEFKDYITDTDFDLYFRSAISMYETGGYV